MAHCTKHSQPKPTAKPEKKPKKLPEKTEPATSERKVPDKGRYGKDGVPYHSPPTEG